jgi:hypothetical protein
MSEHLTREGVKGGELAMEKGERREARVCERIRGWKRAGRHTRADASRESTSAALVITGVLKAGRRSARRGEMTGTRQRSAVLGCCGDSEMSH